MIKPSYASKSISSIEALSKSLGSSPEALKKIIIEKQEMVLPNAPKLKADGTVRQTYRVSPQLKKVQRRIVDSIFYRVKFPSYLQGSIRSDTGTRDSIENARLHAGQRIIISEDISNFFPSISAETVHEMWQFFFNFHPEVAKYLTDLCTLDGYLYQGASTSSYIANLAFWDIEPKLVDDLARRGYKYSRYVDDVTISTNQTVGNSEKQNVISMVYGLFLRKGCKPNRSKHKSYTQRKPALVHNLNTNSGRPTINKPERARVRAAVSECSKRHLTERGSEEYLQLFNSTRGRVDRIKRLHPKEGQALLSRLLELKPTR